MSLSRNRFTILRVSSEIEDVPSRRWRQRGWVRQTTRTTLTTLPSGCSALARSSWYAPGVAPLCRENDCKFDFWYVSTYQKAKNHMCLFQHTTTKKVCFNIPKKKRAKGKQSRPGKCFSLRGNRQFFDAVWL